MQTSLIAGDSLSILDTSTDYPATDGWTHKYHFAGVTATGTPINLTSAAEGADYRTTANSSTTANWIAGTYNWARWVEKSDLRHTLETGIITIKANPASIAAGTDTRSHVEKVLANIELMLEGKASKDVQEYSIENRQLKHYTIPELLVWRDKYKAQLAGEKASTSASQALGRKIHVRF